MKFPHSVIPQRWSILRQLIFQLAPKSNSHILYMPDWRTPTCLGMASEDLGLHTREALESLLNLALQALTGAARLSFTARIERPQFYRGGSANKKDPLTTPFSSPSSPISLHEGGLVDPQLRASNEHILIVRVPRARGRLGRPHLFLLANASSSSAPGRAFHWRL